MNKELKFDHFKNIDELLQHIDIWYKEDDIDYTRWFHLEDLKKVKDFITNLQQENKQLKRDKNIMQNYLELIINIGCDYDGYNDVKNLKELIDELCKYALYGIQLDDTKILSSSYGRFYNILGEEIFGGDKE